HRDLHSFPTRRSSDLSSSIRFGLRGSCLDRRRRFRILPPRRYRKAGNGPSLRINFAFEVCFRLSRDLPRRGAVSAASRKERRKACRTRNEIPPRPAPSAPRTETPSEAPPQGVAALRRERLPATRT